MKNISPSLFDISISKCFFDVDGTLNAMNHTWVNWMNDVYDKNYQVSDVVEWDWYLIIRDQDNVDPFLWFKNHIPYDIGHKHEAIPFANSKDIVSSTAERFGENVFFLTSTHDEEIIPQKNRYLDHYFGETVPTERVIHEHMKHMYARNPDGSVNVLADDKVENCVNWVEAGGVAFLYTHNDEYLYSLTEYEHERLIKIPTLEDFVRIIGDMNILNDVSMDASMDASVVIAAEVSLKSILPCLETQESDLSSVKI